MLISAGGKKKKARHWIRSWASSLNYYMLFVFKIFCILRIFVFFKNVAKLKAKGLHQENDLNKLRVIVKKQNEELQTSVDNVLNLSGELREKGEEMAQIEEQNLR